MPYFGVDTGNSVVQFPLSKVFQKITDKRRKPVAKTVCKMITTIQMKKKNLKLNLTFKFELILKP